MKILSYVDSDLRIETQYSPFTETINNGFEKL